MLNVVNSHFPDGTPNSIIPKGQSLDEGEDLFTEWVEIDKVETLPVDLKTIFLLNLYKLKKIEGF